MKVNPRIAAQKLVQDQYIDDIRIEDLEAVAVLCGMLVKHEKLKSAAASIIQLQDKAIATIDSGSKNLGRIRFSIAHELGHFMLGHALKMPRICTDQMFHEWYQNCSFEHEANEFASELLMPELLYKAEIGGRPPRRQVIQDLSESFQVSITAACIRYAQVGSHPCIVFVSENGFLKWYQPSFDLKDSKHLWPKDQILDWSAAGEYFDSGEEEEGDFSIPYDAWFADNQDKPPNIYETPFYLSHYNTVISMVWFE